MPYTCSLCKATFTQKAKYLKHINRKTRCVSQQFVKEMYKCIKVSTDDDLKENQCLYCKKLFPSSTKLQRHQERRWACVPFNNAQSMIQHAKDYQIQLPPINITGDYNNVNVVGQQINNYNIIVVGKENIEYLPKEIYQEIARNYPNKKWLKDLHRQLHFNKEHPENHTIAKTDKNRNMYHIKDQNGVRTVSFDEVIDDLIGLYRRIANEADTTIMFPPEQYMSVDDRIPDAQHFKEINRIMKQKFLKGLKELLYELSTENKEIARKLRDASVGVDTNAGPIIDIPPTRSEPEITVSFTDDFSDSDGE